MHVLVFYGHALKSGCSEVGQVNLPRRNTNECSFVLPNWKWNSDTLFLCWLVFIETCDSFYLGLAIHFDLNWGVIFNIYLCNIGEVQHCPSENSLKKNWKPIIIFAEISLTQRNKEFGQEEKDPYLLTLGHHQTWSMNYTFTSLLREPISWCLVTQTLLMGA